MDSMAASENESKLQVRFISKIADTDLEIPDSAFAVPDRLTRQGLAEVINGMLELDPEQPFDFLINNEFLRCSLASFVKTRHLSTELTLKIDVVRPFNAPKPQPSPAMDDWVGCVSPAMCGPLLGVGLYNNSVCVCDHDLSTASPVTAEEITICGTDHEAPVKGVDIVACADHGADGGTDSRFLIVSASQDCTLRCWLRTELGESFCLGVCDGHTDSVDCVRICRSDWVQDPAGCSARFVSGSWDKTIKLWHASVPNDKKYSPLATRELLPMASMEGHKQSVSCLCWPNAETVYSGSLDHTIRIWDMERASESRTIYGSKRALTCIDFSARAGRIVTGHSDHRLRLWDPRAAETTLRNQLVGTGAPSVLCMCVVCGETPNIVGHPCQSAGRCSA